MSRRKAELQVRIGLIMSALLHAAILAWALISIRSPRDFGAPVIEPMAVNLVTPDELTRLKQGSRDAKRMDAIAKIKPKIKNAKPTAKPKPVRAAAVPPPPPPPDPIAEALAKQKAADAKKKAEAEKLAKQKAAEAKKRAIAKKKASAKKKAAEKKRKAAARKKALAKKRRLARARKRKAAARKKRLAALEAKRKMSLSFNADRISALLNKVPDKARPSPSADKPPLKRRKSAPGLGAPEGRDDRLTASEVAVLKSMISRQLADCWSLPGGGGGSEVPVVTLTWRLRPNGSLDGEPHVTSRRSGTIFQIYAEAAKNAVRRCSPFRLPPDKYRNWRQITWEFDPRQML